MSDHLFPHRVARAQEVTPQEFAAAIKKAREATSDGGDKISLEELKELMAAAKSAREVRYAVGQLDLSIDDLKGIYAEMVKDGSFDETELNMLYEAAIAPKTTAEAGASVSAGEVALFNNVDKLTPGAKRLFDAQVAPRMSAMLDAPARAAGVRVKSAATASVEPMLPRGARNPNAMQMVDGKWLAPNATWGFGSSTVRIAATNFEINNTATGTGWYDDGVRRSGSWQSGDIGKGEITKMPANGRLDFTLMTHPSGHHDSEGQEEWKKYGSIGGNTNSWAFSRDNIYSITVRYIRPDAGGMAATQPSRGKVLAEYQMDYIRNSPKGEPDMGKFGARGNEEYVTMQDLSLDISKLKSGDLVYIEMWPNPSGRAAAPSTFAGNYSTNRIFELKIP